MEWIEERLAGMEEVLERRTDRSAFLLQSLLGQIRLEPVQGQIGRPYHVARTFLDTWRYSNRSRARRARRPVRGSNAQSDSLKLAGGFGSHFITPEAGSRERCC